MTNLGGNVGSRMEPAGGPAPANLQSGEETANDEEMTEDEATENERDAAIANGEEPPKKIKVTRAMAKTRREKRLTINKHGK